MSVFSMTGYACATAEVNSGALSLELRAVNHRYLDVTMRMPDDFRSIEVSMREKISAALVRGKVECRINFQARNAQVTGAVDNNVMQALLQQAQKISTTFPDARPLSVAEILSWPGVVSSAASSDDELKQTVFSLLEQALVEFNAARAREGEKLQTFLLERLVKIAELSREVAPRMPAAVKAYEERLINKLKEALNNVDQERLCQEIALFASKIDVDEELSRLLSHIEEVKHVLAKGSPVGKRLDFLMQEFNREANTLASKAVDVEVSRCALDMKMLIEQMREQVQNIE